MPLAKLRAGAARCALLILFAVLAATAWSSPARALDPDRRISQYVSQTWKQAEDGLPQNMVAAMAQTPDGYLWLASQEGLVRFDGVRFTVFDAHNAKAIVTGDLDALVVDHDGVLFIGTRGGGLVRYDAETFSVVPGIDPFVNALFEDRAQRLWIGTRQGVTVIDHGTRTIYRVKDGLPSDVVWSFAEDAGGTMWVGTDAGLVAFTNGKLTAYTTKEGLTHDVILALHVDHEDTLWIGTKGGGLNSRVHGTFHALTTKDGLGDDSVTSVFEDHDHNLWIGTSVGGIHRLAKGVLTRMVQKAGDHFDSVRTYFEDREKNLWIGLEGGGLLRLKDGKVTTFSTEEGLLSAEIWSIHGGSANDLWLGTKRGVAHYANGAFENFTIKEGLANDVVFSIEPSKNGGVWLGTDGGGISYFKDGKFKTYDTKSGLKGDTIWSIHEDEAGALWIGTFPNGLVRLENGHFTLFDEKTGMPPFGVLQIAESPDKALWLGTSGGGLVRMKDGKFTAYGKAEGLRSDTVETVYIDSEGVVWAGTSDGGLARFKDGKLVTIGMQEGLYDDTVLQVVDDLAGNFWMTSNKGIFKAAKSDIVDVMEKRRPSLVSTSYGMIECNGGGPGGWRTPDGKLWFATVKGAAMVDPTHMPTNTLAPPVLVEQVEVDRMVLDSHGKHDLAPGARDFAFRYTALSFTTPEKVRFKYRLEGFDRDWIDAGGRRTAYYTNLAPGNYRFRVMAANDDGVWNEAGAAFDFYLMPRFYQTWPFMVAVALGVILIGAGTIGLRVRRLRLRAIELELKVAMRTDELATANDEVQAAFAALAEKDARLHEDLLQAQAFQQRILPKMPVVESMTFDVLYKPADMVGGDIYDVCELAPREVGARLFRVFVADTTGHGIQASLRTMVLKTEYDRIKLLGGGPGDALGELNRKIARDYPGLEMRCSACCFDVEIPANSAESSDKAKVRYANAAHPPLLHVAGAKVTELSARGTFLGIIDDVTFEETIVLLHAGDLLVAYTDGICEQENEAGKPFGLERIESLLAAAPLEAPAAIALLDREMLTFAGARSLDDDVLIVCVECRG